MPDDHKRTPGAILADLVRARMAGQSAEALNTELTHSTKTFFESRGCHVQQVTMSQEPDPDKENDRRCDDG